MLNRMGVRAKINAVFAVPMVVLIAMSGWFINTSVTDARHATEVKSVAAHGGNIASLLTALRWERAFTRMEMTATRPDVKGMAALKLAEVRNKLDNARKNVAELRNGDPLIGDSTQNAVKTIVGTFDTLDSLRKDVDTGAATPDAVYVRYTTLIDRLVAVPGVIANELDDPDLAGLFSIFARSEQVLSGVWDVGMSVAEAMAAGQLTPAMRDGIIGAQARFEADMALLKSENELEGTNFVFPNPLPEFIAARDQVLSAQDGNREQLNVVQYLGVLEKQSTVYNQALLIRTDGIDRLAEEKQQEALRSLLIISGILVLTLLVGSGLSFYFGYRVTKRLRTLTEGTETVRHQLTAFAETLRKGEVPETIHEVHDDVCDEIGRLASSIHAVNEAAAENIEGQVQLRDALQSQFVNIARRDQVLLGRQLAFLDQLEQGEQDEYALSNLYRLDHLATRMRRNAESLLVLAGVETGRRPRQAMAMSDVMRIAASEIEDYERVDCTASADPNILGRHALSAAHLLAELMENACRFSNPGTRVHATASVTDSGVQIMITDSGLGMTEDELAAANEKIVTPMSADDLKADKLGLYVVGQLARKLDAFVELESELKAGSVAIVELPIDIFESEEATSSHGATDDPAEHAGVDAIDAALPGVQSLLDSTALGSDLAAFNDPAGTGSTSAPAAFRPVMTTPTDEVVDTEAGNPTKPLPSRSRRAGTPQPVGVHPHDDTAGPARSTAAECGAPPDGEPMSVFDGPQQPTGEQLWQPPTSAPVFFTEDGTAHVTATEDDLHQGPEQFEPLSPHGADVEDTMMPAAVTAPEPAPELAAVPTPEPGPEPTPEPTPEPPSSESPETRWQPPMEPHGEQHTPEPAHRVPDDDAPTPDAAPPAGDNATRLAHASAELLNPLTGQDPVQRAQARRNIVPNAAKKPAPTAAPSERAAGEGKASRGGGFRSVLGRITGRKAESQQPEDHSWTQLPDDGAYDHQQPTGQVPAQTPPELTAFAPAEPTSFAQAQPTSFAPPAQAAPEPPQHHAPEYPQVPRQANSDEAPAHAVVPPAPAPLNVPDASEQPLGAPSQNPAQHQPGATYQPSFEAAPPAPPAAAPHPAPVTGDAPFGGPETDESSPKPMDLLASDKLAYGTRSTGGIGDSLRQRSELASQALAELSMLSAYSPEADPSDSKPPLHRRQRGATAPPPAQAARTTPPRPRDASAVRSTLSGFTSGANRGRGKH